MLYLIGYDVNTTTKEGRKRLNKVAKECCNYGQRVQNSLFECNLDANHYLEVKEKLIQIVDKNEDSLRIYKIAKNYELNVEHYGIKDSLNLDDAIIL